MDVGQTHARSRVWVFFYGTFMSARVLREHGVDCESTVPAVLNGHRLTISPRANLVADPGAVAYGGLALLRDEETDSLYKGLEDDYSLVYKPQSVVTKTFEGDDRAALCYFCTEMEPVQAEQTYVEEMVSCSEELGLPADHVEHVRSFGP